MLRYRLSKVAISSHYTGTLKFLGKLHPKETMYKYRKMRPLRHLIWRVHYDPKQFIQMGVECEISPGTLQACSTQCGGCTPPHLPLEWAGQFLPWGRHRKSDCSLHSNCNHFTALGLLTLLVASYQFLTP